MINSMISNIANNGDVVCNYCIGIITIWSKNIGLSYGEANILLFVILMPLIIFMLLMSTIFHNIKWLRKFVLTTSIIIIMFIIITLLQATADMFLLAK